MAIENVDFGRFPGDTPFVRWDIKDPKQHWALFDFQKKTGSTHKTEGALEAILHAQSINARTVSVISSGNYRHGLWTAIAERGGRLRLINLVNSGEDLPWQLVMRDNRILRDGAEREAYVNAHILNAGKVFDCTDYIPKAYEQEAKMLTGLGFDYIGLPVGSGKLFVALYREIQRNGLKTRLIGVIPKGENGIFNDDNLYEEGGLLFFKEFDPKSIADKLVCPYTFYKNIILQARREGHLLYEVENPDLYAANALAAKNMIWSSYSGSAALVLSKKSIRRMYDISPKAEVLLINTGKGLGEKQEPTLCRHTVPWLGK